MNLSKLRDQDILSQLKTLVQNERELLTSILHHLREVEKRRLFSELKYSSLFEYAIKELKYSEPQAGRRISAMRLLKELPQVEEKIQAGTLNLSNLCQAHTYFRAADKKAKSEKLTPLSAKEKLVVLERLENKSAREGEVFLLSLAPELSLPKEKERLITAELSEVRFIMDEQLRKNLEQVRSLLGLKGLNMSFKELANEMALMSIQTLKQKSFGQMRVLRLENENLRAELALAKKGILKRTPISTSLESRHNLGSQSSKDSRHKPESQSSKDSIDNKDPLSTSKVNSGDYISKDIKFRVWQRDQGECTNCASKVNLNYDHVHPKALAGVNSVENLRLLCFHCNQRRAFKTFGPKSSIADIRR